MFEIKKWKEFKYRDLFEIVRGRGPRINTIVEGETPFITATEKDNGLTAYVDYEPIHKGNCITVNRNGSIGEAFYQENDFCSTEDVHIFYPRNFVLSKNIAFFMITLIRKEKYRFGYGRKWGIERMKESLIKLPVDVNGTPDWAYMEKYISEKWSKCIPDLEEIKKSKEQQKVSLITQKWENFKVEDLFEIARGKLNNLNDISKGECPIVSAYGENQGIAFWGDVEPKYEKCLTASMNGSKTGYITYHDYAFNANADCGVLIPKFEIDIYIGLFISTVMKKISPKYIYGRKLTMARLKQEKIKLPVTKKGDVDFEYIRTYMKGLNYSNFKN